MSRLFDTVLLDSTGTLAGLQGVVQQLIDAGSQAVLILAADGDKIAREDYDTFLQSLDIAVYGGLFPRLIYRNQCLSAGHIVCAFDESPQHVLIDLTKNQLNIDVQLASETETSSEDSSYLLLVDGLSKSIDYVVERVYYHYGASSVVVGGGTGYATLKKGPSLMTNQGLSEEAAMLVALPKRINLKVSSGWQKALGPYLVTGSDGNVIHTLNYEPAADVYCKALASLLGKDITPENFNQFAVNYPVGMERIDGDVIIRDPISVDNQSLVCVGAVPQYSMVNIMTATHKELVGAASSVASELNQALPDLSEGDEVLLFDCVSRMFCMGENFEQELKAIQGALSAQHVIGALTLGEIASSPSGNIQLHNKSTVLCGCGG